MPLVCLLTIFCFAREDRRPVHFHIFHFEAEFGGALEVVVDFGVMQEHFRGNAADVQAGAADVGIFFDDGGLQPILPGANRGDVPARSAADNHQIILGQTGPPGGLARPATSCLFYMTDAGQRRGPEPHHKPRGMPEFRILSAAPGGSNFSPRNSREHSAGALRIDIL